MPTDEGERDIVAEAAAYSLDHDVRPRVTDAFARSRLDDAELLIRIMDRRRRYGAALDAIECDEMASVLGTRPATRAEGTRALDDAIRAAN